MIKKVLIIFFLCLFFSPIKAQLSNFSNDFLNIGVNAGAVATGNAVIAQNQGANAVFWNPASLLSDSNTFDFSLSHQSLYSSLAIHDFFSAVYRKNNSALGVGVLRLGIDDIQNTLNLRDSLGVVDYNRISYFSVANYALFISYSGQINFKYPLYYSLSPKIIYRHIGQFTSAYGLGVDFGLFFPYKKWNFGATIKNFTGTYTFWSINQSAFNQSQLDSLMPSHFQNLEIALQELVLGVNRNFIFNEFFGAQVEMDFRFPFGFQQNSILQNPNMAFYPAGGAEFNYKNMAFFRLGINQFQKFQTFEQNAIIQARFSVGAGFKIRGISLDYAFNGFTQNNQLPSSHVVTLGYRID